MIHHDGVKHMNTSSADSMETRVDSSKIRDFKLLNEALLGLKALDERNNIV